MNVKDRNTSAWQDGSQLSFFVQRQEAIWRTAKTAVHGLTDEREKVCIWKGMQILVIKMLHAASGVQKKAKISTTCQNNIYN